MAAGRGESLALAQAHHLIFYHQKIMDIKQVQAFVIHNRVDDSIRYVFRDPFANDPTAFRYQQRTRTGEILKEFQVLESTAQLSLDHALKLQDLDKNMVSVEVERFSCDSPALKTKFR